MKRILVTGAYSFIAGYVAEELKRKGYYVVGTVHHLGEVPKGFDELYLADMRDRAAIYSAVEHVDGVIHLAGLLGTSENIRQPELMTEVNVGGALNVLNAVENFKIPSVFIGVGNYWMNNTYSISKYMAERYALMFAENFKTPVNVVRALNAYGPRQKWGKIRKIIPTFINAALRREDIPVYGGHKQCSKMDMIYVGDVARTLVDVLGTKSFKGVLGQVYEAGTGSEPSVWEIASRIKEVTKSKSKLIEVPMRAGETNNSRVVAEKPYFNDYRKFDEAIIETVEYYKALYKAEKDGK